MPGYGSALAAPLGFAVYYESTLHKTYRLYIILLWSPIGLWALGHLVAIWYDDRRFSFSGGLVASALLTSIEHAIIYLVAVLSKSRYDHTPDLERFAVFALFSFVAGYGLFFFLFTPIFYLFRDIRTYANAEKCANCGYCLFGLPENRCPKCGLVFDPGAPETAT